MKFLKLAILLSLLGFFACEDQDDEYKEAANKLEVPCTSELIYVDTARLSETLLIANEIPSKIRAFIAAEFPGRTLSSAREFITKDQQNFTEVRVDQIGYLLFDETESYRCVIDRYPSSNTDITTINPSDELVAIEENGSCSEGIISFKFQVHPILVSNCAQSGCHNSKDREDGVDVETYEEVIKEVRVGDAARSEHYRSITRNPNHRKFMPERPRDPLLASEIQIIGDWINQGAENTDCITPCTSTATSFSKDIQPLFKLYCYGCHQAGDKQGAVSMEDYEHILDFVRDGSLLGSMKHDNAYVAMPLYLEKMTDCQIAQVENWIIEGAQNN